MFYQVKIYTPKGNLKKVVSSQQLSQRHWDAFEKRQVLRKNLEAMLSGVPAKQEKHG
jgi:hypothetical protein